ncbi:MAG: 1-acyl-sn-glycerol-3-phosphate acyltransferase, partial [Clostridia bacterium]|nr:1-acyl-sn-glycerol-3-phosphate acyltransferase [Clostridia bacterium]
MNKKFYRFTCAFLGAIYRVLYPSRVDGLENIPAEGGFILCCNHISNRDPFYLALPCKNRFLHFMAKAELFKWKPLAAFVRALGGFPVDRGHNDLNAVRTSLKLVADGHGLALFPQGTRSRDNSRTPMLGGVSMIALRSGA